MVRNNASVKGSSRGHSDPKCYVPRNRALQEKPVELQREMGKFITAVSANNPLS